MADETNVKPVVDFSPPAPDLAQGQTPETQPEPAVQAPVSVDEAPARDPYEPDTAVLTLGRDNVFVSGVVDPSTGRGYSDIHDKLVEALDAVRAGKPNPHENTVAQAHGEAIAAAAGHEFEDGNGRCLKCHTPRWAAQLGEPCVPKATATEDADFAEVEEPDGQVDSGTAQVAAE